MRDLARDERSATAEKPPPPGQQLVYLKQVVLGQSTKCGRVRRNL